MNPKIIELGSLFDELYKFLKLAVEVGNKCCSCDIGELVKHTDHRQRILQRTNSITENCKQLLSKVHLDKDIPITEKAFIQEKRLSVMDMIPLLGAQAREIDKKLSKKLTQTKSKLISQQKAKKAVGAYMRAPSASPWAFR